MKICFLAPSNSVHSYRWIKYFVEKGHDVYWISLYSSTSPTIHNVKYHEIYLFNRTRAYIFYAPLKVKRLIRNIRPDILHVHSLGIYGIIAALSGYHPLVATAWGSDVLTGSKSYFKRPFLKYVLKKADLLTCDAEHMIDTMVELGADEKTIRHINFGIDTNKFKPTARDEGLRTRLKIFESPAAIISLRNFLPVYDIESLIYAVPHVLKEIPQAQFFLAGEGPQEETLRNLCQTLGVSEQVRFIGLLPNEELPRYLSLMDVYVSTSLSDAGIASSTGEAMACGLPVVITDSAENRKWVKDGEGGFVVPPKSPEILAEKIINLLKDQKARTEFGGVNRKVIMERNDYYKEMKKMENIYKELIRNNVEGKKNSEY